MKLFARIQKQDPLYTTVSLDALSSPFQVDSALAQRDLNHTPRSFEETIADTVTWFAENGYFQRPISSIEKAR